MVSLTQQVVKARPTELLLMSILTFTHGSPAIKSLPMETSETHHVWGQFFLLVCFALNKVPLKWYHSGMGEKEKSNTNITTNDRLSISWHVCDEVDYATITPATTKGENAMRWTIFRLQKQNKTKLDTWNAQLELEVYSKDLYLKYSTSPLFGSGGEEGVEKLLFYHLIKRKKKKRKTTTKKKDMPWKYGTFKHNDGMHTNTYMRKLRIFELELAESRESEQT